MMDAEMRGNGYVVVSRVLMRGILAEDPMNVAHARLVCKAAEMYCKQWPGESLEIAREIWKVMGVKDERTAI